MKIESLTLELLQEIRKNESLQAENAKLCAKLEAVEKERDAAVEDFESAAHTGSDFCEFCSTSCIDAGNDYIKDTYQCGMFKWRGEQEGEEG